MFRRALPALVALAGLALLAPAAGAAAGPSLWTQAARSPAATKGGKAPAIRPARFRAYTLDHAGMLGALRSAPPARSAATLTVSLPAPGGGFQRFAVRNSPVMAPGAAARHPDIVTLAGRGLDDRTATVRLDIGPIGFHASVRGARGTWYVDPYYQRDQSLYVSYRGSDVATDPHGGFVERDLPHARTPRRSAAALDPTVTLRTYRLALLSDPTYNAYFSDLTPPGVDTRATQNLKVYNAKVALMNRVNQVYEDELAIHMRLIDETEDFLNLATRAEMNQPNGPCGGASCFTYTPDNPATPDIDESDGSAAFCSGDTLEDTQTTLGQILDASKYDIGHVALGLNGGGVAELAVVGGSLKGWGCTGIPEPVGDFYAVDYVSHEMGHQFAGNHPFNGTQHNCADGNRNPGTSVEPGSGSSIMAYAGICRQDNLQPHSDPYFSQRSFEEMSGYVTSSQPAIDEVQNVGLRGFDGTDSFKISLGASQSTLTVKRGTVGAGQVAYSNAGIKAAIESIPALAGTTVTVDHFGHSAVLDDPLPTNQPVDDTGFQVTFDGGTLAGQDVPSDLSITSASGLSGPSVVGETEHGGPVKNQGDATDSTVGPGNSVNSRPVVTAPPARTIPTRTPFTLTGSATDDGSFPLTYMWEQNDAGGPTGTALADNHKLAGPLFRQFGTSALVSDAEDLTYPAPGEYTLPHENAAGEAPTRDFPDMTQILAGTTNQRTGSCPAAPPDEDPLDGLDAATPLPQASVDCYSEFLPTAEWIGTSANRTLHFRLTARDGNPGAGGVGHADTTVRIAPTAGPFLVTSPATGPLRRDETETVRWDVARTNLPPVSVANVRITMSTDGGQTFPIGLAASTPNDGAQTVDMPDVASNAVRIKVESIGNTFFDVSHGNAVLEYAPQASTDAPSGRTVDYSDAIAPVTVSASDRDGNGSALTATASGLPAGLALASGPASANGARPGTRSFMVAGATTAAPRTYPVAVAVRDGAGSTRTVTFPVVVAPEHATAAYTGDAAAEGRQGTATLSADVAEVADGAPGDIGTATVTFSQRGTPVCGPVPVTRRADGTGTASCAARLDGGAHPVDVNVGGNYTAATNVALARANPALCDSAVAITGLARTGKRVRISGFAERRFAGQRVTLTAGGRRVARPRVGADGSFAARVKAPRGRRAARTVYQATVAGLPSPRLRLGRALGITSVKVTRVRGTLTGRRHARRKLAVIRLSSCTSSKRIKTVRTDPGGRFSLRLPRPRAGTIAVYRVRTASGRPAASSLPVVLVRR